MELNNLKARLKTAVRGHKLLKDKRDELMRRFIESVRENNQLRQKVESALVGHLQDFVMAKALELDFIRHKLAAFLNFSQSQQVRKQIAHTFNGFIHLANPAAESTD